MGTRIKQNHVTLPVICFSSDVCLFFSYHHDNVRNTFVFCKSPCRFYHCMPYDCHHSIGFQPRLTSRAYGRLLAVPHLQFCIVFPLLNFYWNDNGSFSSWNKLNSKYGMGCLAPTALTVKHCCVSLPPCGDILVLHGQSWNLKYEGTFELWLKSLL